MSQTATATTNPYWSPLPSYGLVDAIGHRTTPPGLVESLLELYSGHPVPALYRYPVPGLKRRAGWHRAPSVTRDIAYRAHVLGRAFAGSYPHRGDGQAAYLCIDLDNHDGQADIGRRLYRVVDACQRAELLPLAVTSRSGTGAHVFVFLDGPLPTETIHTAGRELLERAGVHDRADVIPSARHPKGYGTQHALPLAPLADPGGGLVLGGDLRPILELEAATRALRAHHEGRSPAVGLESVARNPHKPRELSRPRWRPRRGPGRHPDADIPHVFHSDLGDAELVEAMRTSHPQFRRALASSAEDWPGGRSQRDAVLASQMARQGVSPEGIAAALLTLPETKASVRGEEYADGVAAYVTGARARREPVALAGQPGRSSAEVELPAWWPRDRIAPPRRYGSTPNPWWSSSVQDRLRRARSKLDGVALAYLIDRWFRGAYPLRQYFLGRHGLASALDLPAGTVRHIVGRLRQRYGDVLHVEDGVRHPVLRVATAYSLAGALQTSDAPVRLRRDQPDADAPARVDELRGEPQTRHAHRGASRGAPRSGHPLLPR